MKLVDELKNMENQYYTNLLEAQGADATRKNVALFAETTEKVAQLGQVPAYVLGIQKQMFPRLMEHMSRECR
mgnify:CR=1 FL=1